MDSPASTAIEVVHIACFSALRLTLPNAAKGVVDVVDARYVVQQLSEQMQPRPNDTDPLIAG